MVATLSVKPISCRTGVVLVGVRRRRCPCSFPFPLHKLLENYSVYFRLPDSFNCLRLSGYCPVVVKVTAARLSSLMRQGPRARLALFPPHHHGRSRLARSLVHLSSLFSHSVSHERVSRASHQRYHPPCARQDARRRRPLRSVPSSLSHRSPALPFGRIPLDILSLSLQMHACPLFLTLLLTMHILGCPQKSPSLVASVNGRVPSNRRAKSVLSPLILCRSITLRGLFQLPNDSWRRGIASSHLLLVILCLDVRWAGSRRCSHGCRRLSSFVSLSSLSSLTSSPTYCLPFLPPLLPCLSCHIFSPFETPRKPTRLASCPSPRRRTAYSTRPRRRQAPPSRATEPISLRAPASRPSARALRISVSERVRLLSANRPRRSKSTL